MVDSPYLQFIFYCLMHSDQKREIEKILKTQDHYQVLGVSSKASQQQIKVAYRNSALRFHPDKNSLQQSKEAFHKVSSAYEMLNSQNKKSNYDQEIMKKANEAKRKAHQPPKREERRGNSENYRQEERPRPSQFRRPQRQSRNQPDFSKYFKPAPNPYNPKRSGSTFPQPQNNLPPQPQIRRRAGYQKRQANNSQSWTRILLTLIFFFLFWKLVPDFTKTEPKFLFQKSAKYNVKVLTSRYRFPYYVQVQHVNTTLSLQPKIQKLHISKLQSECQAAMDLKSKYERLVEKDPLNAIFWMKQMKQVSYRPCKKILKLVKKYPKIELIRFVHLIK